jgi:hypothetical protein
MAGKKLKLLFEQLTKGHGEFWHIKLIWVLQLLSVIANQLLLGCIMSQSSDIKDKWNTKKTDKE